MWGADWKYCHEGTVWHHKACQVMPNSYPEWRNFRSHRQPLWILYLAYSPFDDCIQVWMCVILSIIRWNKYIFRWRDTRIGSYLRCWCRNFGGKLTLIWRQSFKIAILTTCTRGGVLHPRVKRHFLAPDGFMEIRWGMQETSEVDTPKPAIDYSSPSGKSQLISCCHAVQVNDCLC